MSNEEDYIRAIVEMRGELANAARFIKEKNKVALKAVLRSCFSDAKKFFGDDKTSVDDFKEKLQEIYKCFKADDPEQATAITQRQLYQVNMLITHFADTGTFSESTLELLAGAMAEIVIQEVQDGVSDFDMEAGKYCHGIFPCVPTEYGDLMYGMAQMLKGIFLGSFADGRASIEWINAKRAQDAESEASIEITTVFAKRRSEERMLEKLADVAASTSTPRLIHLSNRIVALNHFAVLC